MPVQMSGRDVLLSGALEPLLDMGQGRNSVNRATQSPAEGHSFCGASERISRAPAEIRPEAFKRPLLTHRNPITTVWKRVGRVSRDHSKSRESILEEVLAKNVSTSLHNYFCLNR